jgi:hypothetical protein
MASRSQLTESEYLASYGVTADAPAVVHARSASALAPTDGSCASCARLLRARAAAAAQLLALTRSEEESSAEIVALRAEVAALRAGGASGGARGATTGGSAAAAGVGAALAAVVDVDDVRVEGDGPPPRAATHEWSPHGASNVLCCACVPNVRAEGGGVVGDRVIVSGAADGVVAFSRVSAAASDTPVEVFARATLGAPVLSLAARPSIKNGETSESASVLLAAACMDGSVALVGIDVLSSSQRTLPRAADKNGGARVVWRARDHDSYATRVAWSADGALLASASADGSVVVYTVVEGGGGEGGVCVVEKMQRFFFSAGAVDAIAWASEQVRGGAGGGTAGLRVDALVIAARTAPVLYYVHALHGDGSLQIADSIVGVTGGTRLRPSADGTTGGLTFILHRAPLSEDGPFMDVSWRSLLATLDNGCALAADGDATAAPAPAPSPMFSAPAAAPCARVGFSLVDITVAPAILSGDGCMRLRAPLVAAVTDAGTLFCFRFGSAGRGSVVQRAGGTGASGEGVGASAPRLAWVPRDGGAGCSGDPFYLAVARAAGDVAIFSVSSGRPSAVLLGHTAAVKDVAATADGALISCGLDKAVRVWV